MPITSARFKLGIKGDNAAIEDGRPQIAFIGRSNAGKSSLINSITGVKNLAISSKTPGRTQEINVFLINDTHYFMDLPGYGFAKTSGQTRDKLGKLIFWYLLNSKHNPKIVLLIDAEVGPTHSDLEVLRELERAGKDLIIVLNKVDKIQKSHYKTRLDKLKQELSGHKLFPYSSTAKIGIEELTTELLSS